MTYSLSIFGSMDNLDDESQIEAKARELVNGLSGITSATLTTTHGGSVNLVSSPDNPAQTPGAGDVQASGTEPAVNAAEPNEAGATE